LAALALGLYSCWLQATLAAAVVLLLSRAFQPPCLAAVQLAV